MEGHYVAENLWPILEFTFAIFCVTLVMKGPTNKPEPPPHAVALRPRDRGFYLVKETRAKLQREAGTKGR